MNKDIYISLINWLKKHNINTLSYNVFSQFETSQINYFKIFEKLDVSSNFYLFQIDNFIKKDSIILKKYKENIIFQYSYLILSSYVFKNKLELIEGLNTVHEYILACQYEQLDTFLKSLEINNIIDKEFDNTIVKINKFINNPIYVSYIQKIYNSKQNLGNLCYSNVFDVHSIITDTLKMLFVHQGNVDLIDFLENIKNISIDEYSVNLLKRKFNNSKVNFFQYMLSYYNNRFFYHGTSSRWLNSIKKYGLNGVHIFKYQNEITKVINIFEEHGIYKIFDGKNVVEYIRYYVTDSIGSAVYYSHQSPEYLSRFCSNGDCMKLLENCDCESFWRRDYDTCLNNVQKLCKSAKLNEKDTSLVTGLFKKLWKEEVKKGQIPIIYVGLIQILKEDSRSFDYVKDNLDSYSFNQIYNIFTQPSNIHNKRFATIEKKHLNIIKLPNLYQLYHIKQSDFPEEKYIIYNNIKYFPDIIIKNEYFNDIYIIINNNKKIQKISSCVYSIPYNFKYADCYIDNEYYKQKLKYLLITNGVGLTTKGKEYLFNNNLDFFEVYKYYLDLSIYLINIYVTTKNVDDKIDLFSIIANNVFYNLYIMNKTGNFPCIVDYGYKSKLHYDYDYENYWYRSKEENNISVSIFNSIIEIIIDILNTIKEEKL